MRAPAFAVVLVAAAAAAVPGGDARAEDLGAHAARLVRGAIVVDTHEEVPWELRDKWADLAVAGATKH
ncbi:MAG TPA: hypothetical protein VF997_07670, partial [Polyangia bacterium]